MAMLSSSSMWRAARISKGVSLTAQAVIMRPLLTPALSLGGRYMAAAARVFPCAARTYNSSTALRRDRECCSSASQSYYLKGLSGTTAEPSDKYNRRPGATERMLKPAFGQHMLLGLGLGMPWVQPDLNVRLLSSNTAPKGWQPNKRKHGAVVDDQSEDDGEVGQDKQEELKVADQKLLFGEGLVRRLGWGPDQLIAPDGANRWIYLPAATMNHVCLGAIFAWSIFNKPLTSLEGVVVSSASDWALGDIQLTFSLVMGGFVWGAVFGKYLDAYGARTSCLIGGAGLGTGFALAGLACQTHNLELLYAGGLLWGLSNGWAYVPPVANLLRWFPEKKGLASGACIMGYGGGALLCTKLSYDLLGRFKEAPEYLGKVEDVSLMNEGGRLFVEGREVVVATASDLVEWASMGLSEGVYVVGTGSTGVTDVFFTLGGLYTAIMLATSFIHRRPSPAYEKKAAESLESNSNSNANLTTFNVEPEVSVRSPQFWLMYAGFGLAVTGSYGILSTGKTLITECMGTAMPEVVSPAVAASFIAGMSVANLGGRIFWSNVSDKLTEWKGGDPLHGRKIAYATMWGLAPPMYMGVLWSIHEAAVNPGTVPLAVFTACSLGIISSFGGAAATRPALAGDLFGIKNVGINSARQLSVVMPAAYLGPKLVTHFRTEKTSEEIENLVGLVDDDTFRKTFDMGKDQLDLLVEQKTVTIARLMDIVPAGTPDPTLFLYDKTMYVMAALQAGAFVTNYLLQPVPSSSHSVDGAEK